MVRAQDHLTRATNGFKSAVDFMMAKDNTELLQNFRDYTNKSILLGTKIHMLNLQSWSN